MRASVDCVEQLFRPLLHTSCVPALCMSMALLCAPEPAHACGGTFCDSGASRSVDQSGENILFVEFEGHLEAHVQIRYQGDPARFAWLVPLPEEPEVEIGSQRLFDAMLDNSAPIYGVRTITTHCDGTVDTTEDAGCGGQTSSESVTGVAGSQSQSQSGMMRDPVGKTVGSFEVAFLRPKSAEEVTRWLADNAFQVPVDTEATLAPYLEAGSVIAAVRFAPSVGVQEIHPIVFRFSASRPAIPLQLTAVAATADMRVRAFFLGKGRFVPGNYRHIELNPLRLSWPGFLPSYENSVALATDETSDGRGFVTEYAGPSSIVAERSVHDARWNAKRFTDLDPIEAVAELKAQGQLVCADDRCELPHPLMLPLLQRYIPAPAGSLEGRFYTCPECTPDDLNSDAWDAAAFAADYQERIIEPAAHAAQLLKKRPYLTRLLTFISPDEMTVDPAFLERDDLGSQSNEHWAERTVKCGEPSRLSFPDGRVQVEQTTGQNGIGALAWLPNAERIEQIGERGSAQVLVDNGQDIDRALSVANSEVERSDDATPADERRGPPLGCAVASPGLQQTALWLLAILFVRRRRP